MSAGKSSFGLKLGHRQPTLPYQPHRGLKTNNHNGHCQASLMYLCNEQQCQVLTICQILKLHENMKALDSKRDSFFGQIKIIAIREPTLGVERAQFCIASGIGKQSLAWVSYLLNVN